MDEYKSNQIKYEQNTNKSNQIKYAAAERRIQIIQIKYATCERIILSGDGRRRGGGDGGDSGGAGRGGRGGGRTTESNRAGLLPHMHRGGTPLNMDVGLGGISSTPLNMCTKIGASRRKVY